GPRRRPRSRVRRRRYVSNFGGRGGGGGVPSHGAGVDRARLRGGRGLGVGVRRQRRSPGAGGRGLRRPESFHRSSMMQRPNTTEYARYYDKYITLVPEDDILPALEAQLGDMLALLRGVPEAQGN